MNLIEISNHRLRNQQVVESQFKTAQDIVGWMGAMQAQDFNMSKWAIGARLPDSTEKLIESAIAKGEIIRTHILRPTWHFVSSEDIYWMLELSAPHIKACMKARDKELGLTDVIFKKSNAVIEKALRDGQHLSREELLTEFIKADIPVDNNRTSHLLMRAETEGIICSGQTKASKQTYALLSERVPIMKPLKRDEALAKLAIKYFTSHCPATLQDFVWWSGLSVSDSKQALEMIKSNFIAETIGNRTYWVTNSFSNSEIDKEVVYCLPAYDEFIISYKDRTASLPFEKHHKAVSNNGIFRPIIVLNGQVIGTWRRMIKKDKVLLDTEFFYIPDKAIKDRLINAFTLFGHYINKGITFNNIDIYD